jgi:hypothetical protein
MLLSLSVASRRRRLVGADKKRSCRRCRRDRLKPEVHSDEARLESLGEEEGGLWRRVIAGERPACIA